MLLDGLLLLFLGMFIVFLFLSIIFVSIKVLSSLLFRFSLVGEEVSKANIKTDVFVSKGSRSYNDGEEKVLPVIMAAVSYYLKKK